ncbi:conserved hypothetical protein [Trichinella spiralis]|uniref:hypothetical protein n=1 Tax=Trichinella spiralis TaxID=6334 RepID=UPI0001EFCC53|nr:conserved hypothetical protein [Trichinella spiralis]
MRGNDKVLVKFDNAFLYTCGNDVTASRSDAHLYRELELPPNLLKARGQENVFPNRPLRNRAASLRRSAEKTSGGSLTPSFLDTNWQWRQEWVHHEGAASDAQRNNTRDVIDPRN